MPANIPTIRHLKRLSELINGLDIKPKQGVVDEIKAWNRLLIRHIGQQKRQGGKFGGQRYEYDPKTKKIKRIDTTGEIVANY